MKMKIVYGSDVDAFEDECNELLRVGWTPRGSLQVGPTGIKYQQFVTQDPDLIDPEETG
jgi:hypothetical protein